MRILHGRNVNAVYAQGRALLHAEGVVQDSRVGRVVVCPFPVMSVYDRPAERVLFDPLRDANPLFHLMESLWMLAGRSDSEFLNHFIQDFGARFAEEDGRLHGAYGARWRRWFDGVDQLRVAINRLRRGPRDRRVVISMWDPTYDLFDPEELNEDTDRPFDEPRDIPCNTHIYPRVVNGALDITVCCRSNDAIWGAHGANAVHFSVMQEYLSAGIGTEVGKLYQFSNNYHAYVSAMEKTEPDGGAEDLYESSARPYPLVTDFATWDEDLRNFMHWTQYQDSLVGYMNQFFAEVAQPMFMANHHRRQGDLEGAVLYAQDIAATDWREATVAWLKRRQK